MPEQISRAAMQAAMQEGETRNFEFWQNVFESIQLRAEALETPTVHVVTAADVVAKRIPVTGGMTAYPNSVILVDGIPLVNSIGNEEYILTSFGISEGSDRAFTEDERIVIFKKS